MNNLISCLWAEPGVTPINWSEACRILAANDPALYTHHVFKDYAHLDIWLGTNAERDTFPTALAELEKHN